MHRKGSVCQRRSAAHRCRGGCLRSGAVTLFTIPLTAAMSEQDVSSLVLSLDFDTRTAASGIITRGPAGLRTAGSQLRPVLGGRARVTDSGCSKRGPGATLTPKACIAGTSRPLPPRGGSIRPSNFRRAWETVPPRSPWVTWGASRTRASPGCAAGSPAAELRSRVVGGRWRIGPDVFGPIHHSTAARRLQRRQPA